MSKMISPRRKKTVLKRVREFLLNADHGCGYSFPVDENDTVILSNPDAEASFQMVITRPDLYEDMGVVEQKEVYTEPAVLLCDCGHRVCLSTDPAECPQCGALYNLFGQRLAPREQWGYETGESYMDFAEFYDDDGGLD